MTDVANVHQRPGDNLSSRVVRFAGLTALLAIALLAFSIGTGGSHLAFQTIRPAEDYAALLTERGWLLRLELGVDYVFLSFYAVLFVLTRRVLAEWNETADRSPVWLWILLVSVLFDALENGHVLAMYTAAEQHLVIPQIESIAQSVIGQLKFAANYVGLLLLSFALPSRSSLERMLVFFLRWVQAPLGAAVLVLPAELVRPFGIVRVIGLVCAFLAFARIVHVRSHR